jgi:glycosyltransferase involved in cell wall biosynthesis
MQMRETPLKIAVLSSIAWKTPPDTYGPWEQVAADLAAGLQELGQQVTVFATADSQPETPLASIVPHPYEENRQIHHHADDWGWQHIIHCYHQAHQFDLVHNHFNYRPLLLSPLLTVPLLTTVHSGTIEFTDPYILSTYKRFNSATAYVAISQAAKHPELDYAATIHHGLDVTGYTLDQHPQPYLLMLGRIHPDKGVDRAIQVAKKTHLPLIIAGIIHDQAYFNQKIAPHLSEQIRYIGPVGGVNKRQLIRQAQAMISLTSFAEPLGLSAIEAMLSGTPVIATNAGAYPETVASGFSGFLVDSHQAAVKAVRQLAKLDRAKVREYALSRFSRQRMAQQYLDLYRQLLDHQTPSG